jgi:nucleoid-associated protein YgaU
MCLFLSTAFLFTIPVANAQDVAEAACQEKARKAAQPQKAQTHVYTNDDLQKPQILTPEDRAPVEARRKNSAAPHVNGTTPSKETADDAATAVSLGEIARRLRQEKAARQAEQAGEISIPSLFHIELPSQTTLAQPSSLAPSSPGSALPVLPTAAQPFKSARPTKRDPFSRDPHTSPVSSVSATMPKTIAPSTPTTVMAPRAITPRAEAPVSAIPRSTASKNYGGTVRVQAGDSLWDLSRQYLGKGSRWQEWLIRNPQIVDPRHVQTGAILFVPTAEVRAEISSKPGAGFASSVEDQSAVTVSVRSGDSMWRIAAIHLGRGAAWPCLASANPAVRDSSLIYPGQSLLIPASCAAMKHSPATAVGSAAVLPAAN